MSGDFVRLVDIVGIIIFCFGIITAHMTVQR